MPQPLGTVHKCLENGAPYGRALWRIPPIWQGLGEVMLETPLLTLGALELQAFLTLALLVPTAILSVALSLVTVAELTGNKN